MTELTFGMSFHETYQYCRQGVINYAQTVESLGFDTLWITENVHSGADALEPLTTLSFMAAHTERITLGPSVIILPLRNAVGVAHALASAGPAVGREAYLWCRDGWDCPGLL